MLDPDFVEKIILKGMIQDKGFTALITNVFEKEYFEDHLIGEVFDVCNDHFEKYKNIPSKDIILSTVKTPEKTKLILEEAATLDFDLAENHQCLLDNADTFLRDRAIRKAILDSVDVIEKKKDIQEIKNLIEDALCKTIWIDLGLNYFDQLGQRLKRIMENSDIRVKSYFPTFDEHTNGGFPPYTLSVMCAVVHGFKSSFLCNMSARQVLYGHNVVLMTLEMSEDAFAQRFDSVFTSLDINRIYTSPQKREKLIKKLREIKELKTRGDLYIKQFPTGEASVRDMRIYLRELLIRDVKPSILYVDYLNLMRPEGKSKGELYSDVKKISEQLRALSFEFKLPVISVSQLNRDGHNTGFSGVNFTHIAESMGLSATADYLGIFGVDEDAMIYESELWCKNVKNRLGGRVGENFKLYYDKRSLKLYDESELDIWLSEANISGDSRNIAG